MSVWVTIPSARPIAEVNEWGQKWLDMGYKVLVQRDPVNGGITEFPFFAVFVREYRGYSESVNYLTRSVFREDPNCDWCVATGDDTLPDPTKRADDIARECSEYFTLKYRSHEQACHDPSTFGVMQPTGDDWSDHQGRIIERIAGSPWLGREFCRRANGGQGPLWPNFYHCFADETLQNVAIKLGVFWQRPDLTHFHNNWARARGDVRDKPAFLETATSGEHWRVSKAEFERLKASDWKECLPLS